jgi:phage gp29-like protein
MKLFSRLRPKKPNDAAQAIARTAKASLQFPGAANAMFGQRISLETYEEMLCDPLIKSAITVKKLGALAVPWEVVPNDSPKTKFIQKNFAEMQGSVEGILFDAMDALAKGYAVLEKVIVEINGTLRLHAVKPKDPALFGFAVDEFLNIESLTLHVPGEREKSLPAEKFVIYAHNQRYGRPTGESDLRSAHRHWKIKGELIRQWSAHLEKFASPTVTGKYKRGLPEQAQGALLDALDKIQRQSALIYPDDVEVALLEGEREARTSYLDAIDYHNREIARAILGQTLTTDDSRRVGSLALGKVHLQVLVMQLAGLRKELADRVMNEQIIRPLIDLNFSDDDYPVFRFIEPELDVFRTGKVV